tara:strand:+ start:13836 stop:14060 length:225 start_codon:yes stop_codon:yes gene_type:complete
MKVDIEGIRATGFVDLYQAPTNWAAVLQDAGWQWDEAEPQPIADQFKLHGLRGIPAKNVPFLRVFNERGEKLEI